MGRISPAGAAVNLKHCYLVEYCMDVFIFAGSGNDETIQFAPLSERSESNMQTVIKSMVNESRAKETRRLFSRPSSQARLLKNHSQLIRWIGQW
jgi:hypothetical protein